MDGATCTKRFVGKLSFLARKRDFDGPLDRRASKSLFVKDS
jgi:hypothetical protein